jgi:hypothetical protein
MRTLALLATLATPALLMTGACGSTGGGLVTFTARTGGPVDAAAPIEFDTGLGYHVSLTRARFHLGAVYLNMSRPSSGGGELPCTQPGIYVGEAFGACDAASGTCGVDLDLLSPALTAFPGPGAGTADRAREAEVWLTGGDINASDDPTPILDAAGTATRGGQAWPFTAVVTIGQNRAIPPPSAAMPGANPICRQRIARNIPVDFTLTDGGTLDVRVDPRGMWNGVDFSGLTLAPGATTYVIPDDLSVIGGALYKGLLANSGVYEIAWRSR